MGTITVRRHQYLLNPDEGAITSPSIAVLANRTQEFMNDTNIDPQELIVSPVVQVPVPTLLVHKGERVRPHVSPEMMWFPLFWLPEAVGLRRIMPAEGENEERTESDAEWAIRVMTMAGTAGLFDAETGTWLDVLSTVGLDADDDLVAARVTSWMDGEADPDLDRINLTPLFDETDAEEAANAALENSPNIIAAQYAIGASDLGESITGVLEDETLDSEDRRGAANYFLLLAHQAFFDDPDADSIPKAQSRVKELIIQLHQQSDGAADGAEVLKELRALCGQMYLTFEPFLAIIRTLAGELHDTEESGDGETALEPVITDLESAHSLPSTDTTTTQVVSPTVEGWEKDPPPLAAKPEPDSTMGMSGW